MQQEPFIISFESKETYVSALIEEQEKVWKEQMISGVKSYGKLTLEQAVRIFRESFRKENNILMEFTLDDWVWLKIAQDKRRIVQQGTR